MPILTNSKDFIQNEFSDLDLGDKRLNRRAVDVAAAINAGPASSIPAMTNGNDAQLKGIYRFFQNAKIDDQKILQTHYSNTLERMEAYQGKILLINDSCFVSPAKGFDGLLTRGKGKENCVRTHYCLAISDDGKQIFGILNYLALTDQIKKRYPDLKNESDIWILNARNCIELIYSSSQPEKLLARCLFVADRESDEFELINFLEKNKLGYIIRSKFDRRVIFEDKECKLDEIEDQSIKHGAAYKIKVQQNTSVDEILVNRSVLRDVSIVPPVILGKTYAPLNMNVVLVKEVSEEKVNVKWRLLTSEDVDNSAASQLIVSSYSHRWKIEEVNKSAKTGVKVEERQFTDFEHFLPFLAMAFVVAWRIVALRTVVEVAPETPIKDAFTADEGAYMRAQAKELGLPMKTVKDGLILIARLGGFTGRYKNPGWQILWQGWMKFYERVEGFILARKMI